MVPPLTDPVQVLDVLLRGHRYRSWITTSASRRPQSACRRPYSMSSGTISPASTSGRCSDVAPAVFGRLFRIEFAREARIRQRNRPSSNRFSVIKGTISPPRPASEERRRCPCVRAIVDIQSLSFMWPTNPWLVELISNCAREAHRRRPAKHSSP